MSYSFVSEKGQGGFARVDVVRNDLGLLFAQKTYSPLPQLVHAVGDEHLKRRFIREVTYQSQICHPNVVPILEHFLYENPPRFIMPLADCTLKDMLDADRTLGSELRPALFGILAGLEFIHSKGYIHRDLKPANVLRYKTQSGEPCYAISDFGLISVTNSDSSTLTGTNANGGTENYAAPELIGDFRAATFSADIYAFGAILHDIFGNAAQRIPYTELSLPGAIGDIVSKCTKRLPIRRYGSVSLLRDALYQVLNTEQVKFHSSGEENIVNLLNSKIELESDEWDLVFIQLGRNVSNGENNINIFSALSLEHIEFLEQNSPELLAAMGNYFVESIFGQSFNFDYCDVLATKAEGFYTYADLGLKANIALALLYLGTSHNRWYVERKAVYMINSNISTDLAERIRVEIDVQRIDFTSQIKHLYYSIGFQSSSLHPVLQALL